LNTNKNLSKIIISILVLAGIISIGISGYMTIEGFSFLEAFYMTIITISTVGYGEVHELSQSGLIFTSLLILISLGVLAYVASVITTQFFEGQLRFILNGYQKKSRLKKMENHIIICGFGRNGQQSVNELQALGHKFVVIDKDKELLFHHSGAQFSFIEGDATQDEILELANIQKAKALLTTLPNDADNLFVVLTARSLNSNIKIISRASSTSSEKKLKIAGVNNVVMPERVGGAHMAHLVTHPDVIEFMEKLSIQGDSLINLEEIVCNDLPKGAINKSIDEIGVRKKTGANIIGFKTPEGEYIINPMLGTKIIPNSKIFVLGSNEQIAKMREIFR
jgi:voltage-gated potassium channel